MPLPPLAQAALDRYLVQRRLPTTPARWEKEPRPQGWPGYKPLRCHHARHLSEFLRRVLFAVPVLGRISQTAQFVWSYAQKALNASVTASEKRKTSARRLVATLLDIKLANIPARPPTTCRGCVLGDVLTGLPLQSGV